MEIQFLHENVVEKDPKLLIDRLQKMASGEAPFFPTTLSLVYDKLVEKAFTKHTPFGPGPGDCTEGHGVIYTTPSQASTSTSNIDSSTTVGPAASPSNLQDPVSTPGPNLSTTTAQLARLKCTRCGEVALLRDLYRDLYCPLCPESVKKGRRALMECTVCGVVRGMNRDDCIRKICRRRFM